MKETELSTKKHLKSRIGQKFGRLTVVSYWGRENNTTFWNCLCDCGNTAEKVYGNSLKSGNKKSCGCLRLAGGHTCGALGEARKHQHTTEYRSYASAKNRCISPSNHAYKDYGGRGIEFRFSSYVEFLVEIGRKPSPKHTLNRINNDGHYEKGNIEWATRKEQCNNRRSNHHITIDGKTLNVAQWSKEVSVTAPSIYKRLYNGWCKTCAVKLPRYGQCPHTKLESEFWRM